MLGTVVTLEATARPRAEARGVDAVCRATQLSDQARVLRSAAAALAADRVHAAEHAVRVTRRKLEDLRGLNEDVAHRIRRDPLKIVAAAVVVGLFIGLTAGWIGDRFAERRLNRTWYWR